MPVQSILPPSAFVALKQPVAPNLCGFSPSALQLPRPALLVRSRRRLWVAGPGAICLTDASTRVITQLFGTPDHHEEIRCAVCNHIARLPEEFMMFFEDKEHFDE